MHCAPSRSSPHPRFCLLAASLVAFAATLLAGCGGSVATTTVASQPVAITVEPTNQVIPIGDTATFTVAATGTAPLTYQWSENGIPISGATSATYTTPTIALDSSGSTSIGSFDVTIRNATSSVTSNAVTLTAGPRSPKAGDLRYLLSQQVSLPGFGPTAAAAGDNLELSYPNAIGTPLMLGECSLNNGCGWDEDVSNLPPPMTGLNMNYNLGGNRIGNGYPSIDSYLQSVTAPDVVITSLDIETALDTYALSWVQTAQTGGFDYRLETLPMGTNLQAEIQATAAADGAESRVITAVSFDDTSQMAYLISYGWTGDTTTVYETKTTVTMHSGVKAAAAALANEGYVISAFGGNDLDGYMLVGMRVQGDTLPRPIVIATPSNTVLATNPDSASIYFTLVVFLNDFDITEQ